ncbi:hypothetical protein ON010_g17446 [Phytophthora cinnamomi]|nr:hypothetical protein ON010_g17446 [Phytophthora cinnamomi]
MLVAVASTRTSRSSAPPQLAGGWSALLLRGERETKVACRRASSSSTLEDFCLAGDGAGRGRWKRKPGASPSSSHALGVGLKLTAVFCTGVYAGVARLGAPRCFACGSEPAATERARTAQRRPHSSSRQIRSGVTEDAHTLRDTQTDRKGSPRATTEPHTADRRPPARQQHDRGVRQLERLRTRRERDGDDGAGRHGLRGLRAARARVQAGARLGRHGQGRLRRQRTAAARAARHEPLGQQPQDALRPPRHDPGERGLLLQLQDAVSSAPTASAVPTASSSSSSSSSAAVTAATTDRRTAPRPPLSQAGARGRRVRWPV